MRGRKLAGAVLLGALAAALGSGCIVEHNSPYYSGPTQVAFEETTNLGYFCGGPLTSWTVSNRETGDQGTAGCEQPVLFTNLAGDRPYTFDITGFSGQRSCWEGTCSVFVANGGRTVADCFTSIVHTCGL